MPMPAQQIQDEYRFATTLYELAVAGVGATDELEARLRMDAIDERIGELQFDESVGR